MQTTSHILMIRPVNFTFNAETAVNNAFQKVPVTAHAAAAAADDANSENPASGSVDAQPLALEEFDRLVALLREHGVDVTVIDDTPEPYTPDSIFPNNWISFHEKGLICLYPMFAANRRMERKPAILHRLGQAFQIAQTLNFTHYEREGLFLEGTGSMVLDRDNKSAYACLSPRTDKGVLLDFCAKTGYTPVIFSAMDSNHRAIYHTNVMMCVADRYAVVCLDSLPDLSERQHLAATIRTSGKVLIPISLQQMDHFAGNMLQVHNRQGERLLIMSSQAWHSLTPQQIGQLTSYNQILHSPLTAIETNGGGSARCMMAEIHLEPLSE